MRIRSISNSRSVHRREANKYDQVSQDELDALSEQGNVLCDALKFDEAIQRWSAAHELLPEPRVDWEAYGTKLKMREWTFP